MQVSHDQVKKVLNRITELQNTADSYSHGFPEMARSRFLEAGSLIETMKDLGLLTSDEMGECYKRQLIIGKRIEISAMKKAHMECNPK